MMFLFLIACDSPPLLRDAATFAPNSMDTMAPIEEREELDEASNRRPRIHFVKILPDNIYVDTPATVNFRAEDPERSQINTSFQWYINGRRRIGQSSRRLPSSYFGRGDKLSIELTVSDGENSVSSISPEVEVLNSPPTMEFPGQIGSLNGHQIEASDPDNDRLSFTIEDAPAGLTINTNSGVLSYVATQDSSVGGDYNMTITVTDPSGESASLPLSIQVTPGLEGSTR
jgi:hypothetical protein